MSIRICQVMWVAALVMLIFKPAASTWGTSVELIELAPSIAPLTSALMRVVLGSAKPTTSIPSR